MFPFSHHTSSGVITSQCLPDDCHTVLNHWKVTEKWVCQSKRLQRELWIIVQKNKHQCGSCEEQSSLFAAFWQFENCKLTVRGLQKKRSTERVQLKTRWHLLVIGWLTAMSLLLSSQLDTRLPLEDLAHTETAVLENAARANCGNIWCSLWSFIVDESAGTLWAFLLQTASKLIHKRLDGAEA